VAMLGEIGAWGVNLHDNDLVPIDATPSDRDRILKEFKAACERHQVVVPMATVNLFFDPVFRDGAFTANDANVRAYALQKTMGAMDLGAELGAKIFVLWELSLRVFHRSEIRLHFRARGEAERTARRYLHGHHWRVSRLHPDARPSRDGGGES
jgi:hypothetical protein